LPKYFSLRTFFWCNFYVFFSFFIFNLQIPWYEMWWWWVGKCGRPPNWKRNLLFCSQLNLNTLELDRADAIPPHHQRVCNTETIIPFGKTYLSRVWPRKTVITFFKHPFLQETNGRIQIISLFNQIEIMFENSNFLQKMNYVKKWNFLQKLKFSSKFEIFFKNWNVLQKLKLYNLGKIYI